MSGSADGLTDGGGGDGPPSMYAFQSSWPVHVSLHYGDHDKPPATLTFSHTADSAECTHDDGNTWGACDSASTLVFTADDYNNSRQVGVKLSKTGFPDEIQLFKPIDDLPGLHFYHCDQVVTADEPAAAFYNRLAAGRVVCLASNVSITYSPFDMGMAPSTSGIFLDANTGPNLKVLGTESNRPVFINTQLGGNQGGFVSMLPSLSNVVLSNLQVHLEDGNCISFEQNGGNNELSNLDLRVIGGGNDQAVIFGEGLNNKLYNVDIDAQNSPGTILFHVQTNGTATVSGGKMTGRDDTTVVVTEGNTTASTTLTNVTVEQTSTVVATKQAAVAAIAGTIKVTGGSVTGFDKGIVIGGAGAQVMGNVSGTTVHAKIAVTVGYDSDATLSGLTLQSYGPGVTVDGARLHIDDTLIERLDQAGAAGPGIDVTLQCIISSTNNGNHFCDQNHGGANKFSAALTIESGASNGGNFDLAKQVNMGMVDMCP